MEAIIRYVDDGQNLTVAVESPVLVEIEEILLSWPIQHGGPAVTATLGRLSVSPPLVGILSRAVSHPLETLFSLNLSTRTGGIGVDAKDGFLVVNLRTEADTKDEFGTYAEQSTAYSNHAKSREPKVIYVACGDAAEIAKFRTQAMENDGISVVTKVDLLKGEDLEAMRELSWDQQGLIDFDILSRATCFAGVARSTFSFNLAVKRHLTMMNKDPNGNWTNDEIINQPWWSTQRVGDVVSDSLSSLLTALNPAIPVGTWL